MENTKKPKIKICKCGHLKIDHKEHPEKKLSLPSECKKCKCSSYMNRTLPNKASKIMLVYAFFIIGLVISGMVSIIQEVAPNWNKHITITAGSLVTITVGIFLLLILQVFSVLIYGYYREKKRKTYPVDPGLE